MPTEVDWHARLWLSWSLALLLLLVHLLSGAWLLAEHELSWWDALLLDRDVGARIAVGGQYRTLVESGQSWRLFTSVFLHADALHLVVNSVAVLSLGRLLEPWVGGLRLLSWFCVGGVGASLASQLAGMTQSDGASGGAFALLGAAVVLGLRLRPKLRHAEDRRLLGPVLWGFVALNLVLSFALPFIDAVGHLGGLGIGLLLGVAHPLGGRGWSGRLLDVAVVLLVGLVCGWGWGLG